MGDNGDDNNGDGVNDDVDDYFDYENGTDDDDKNYDGEI